MKTGGKKYTHRVTIYRNSSTRTTNADGQRPETASEVCTRWAQVLPINGRERMLADQNQADITYRVRIRSDVTTRALTRKNWLTLSDGTRLSIARIYDPTQQKQELELECTERA